MIGAYLILISFIQSERASTPDGRARCVFDKYPDRNIAVSRSKGLRPLLYPQLEISEQVLFLSDIDAAVVVFACKLNTKPAASLSSALLVISPCSYETFGPELICVFSCCFYSYGL